MFKPFVTLLLAGLTFPLCAQASSISSARESLFNWSELSTLAGATAATMLIVQFTKMPLDRVWKIPTRLLVLTVSFVILLLAQIFTAGLTPESLPLIALNSFIVAAASMGMYEVAHSTRTPENASSGP